MDSDKHQAPTVVAATPSRPPPYVPPPSPPPTKEILPLSWADPVGWLLLGWHDMLAHLGISLFYGLCFWGMALVMWAVFRNKPEYVMSIISGCVLVGPFLAMGLYDVSRQRESGTQPQLGQSLVCWRSHMGSMGMLVLVLMVLELLWGRASLVVFAVFFNTGMPSTAGVVQAIFNPDNWQFVLVYMVVGSVFAGLVFGTCVVSIPMILDRDTDAISAGITSLQVVFGHMGVLILWGLLITFMVVGGVLLWGAGLIVVGPWLGYASWHAYRGTVKWLVPPGVPERTGSNA